MNLANNLKRIRKDNNLSQEQLAEKLGVSRQAVSKWESGQSYPEMDKVLQICSIFNLNINELINEDIKEVNEVKEAKNISNKYIISFFDYLTKVVDMFSSMKFKQVVGCLMEQFIISIILFILFSLIGSISSGILSNIIYAILPSRSYYFIGNLLEGIYVIAAFILGIAMLLHIFKIRYLDYYTFVKVDIDKENNDVVVLEEGNDKKLNEEKQEESKNKIVLEKRPEKIVIRDPKHSDFKFLSGLGKIILIIVKFFAAWGLVGFSFSLVVFVTFLALSFLFVKTGMFFFGFILAIIGCILINILCIELIYNFIFSKKSCKNRIFIVGLISLLIIGMGSGLLVIGISEFDVAKQEVDLIKDAYTVEMKDNLMIARAFNYSFVEYVEEDRKDVKIEVEHSKYYTSNFEEVGGLIYIYEYVPDEDVMSMLRMVIKDFNDKRIVNYNSDQTIKVYASKKNIAIMKNNRKEYFDDRDKIIEELEKSKNEVNRLGMEADRLESILEINGYIVVRDSNDRIIDIYKEASNDTSIR